MPLRQNCEKEELTMSNDNKPVADKADPKSKETKISPADDLTKTNKSGDIELEEDELGRATGGSLGSHNFKL
jgi:hypothetical protein